MAEQLDDSYLLCIVKRNEGKIVRLADANTLLRYHYTGVDERTEVEIISNDETVEDFKNELWQKYQMIWFSPLHPKIIEATQDDDRAKQEYKILCKLCDTMPDVDPESTKVNSTLIRIISEKGKYRITDGQMRKHRFDIQKGRAN